MKYSIEISLYSIVTALWEFRRAKCRKIFFRDNFFFVVGCRCRPILQQMGGWNDFAFWHLALQNSHLKRLA
jgi:hypothetical protein